MMCNGDSYHEFVTKFLHLASEAEVVKEDYLDEFMHKLSFDLQKMVAVAHATSSSFKEFKIMCSRAAHTLKGIAAATVPHRHSDTKTPWLSSNSPTDRKAGAALANR